jgi:hypothetical protein
MGRVEKRLGGSLGEGERRGRGEPIHRNRVVAPVSVTAAVQTFFFHVADFAVGPHFAILADYTPASQRCEAEKPDETHHATSLRASFVPDEDVAGRSISPANIAVFIVTLDIRSHPHPDDWMTYDCLD